MPWLKSCLSPQPARKKPTISPPLHLLLKPDGESQNHIFRAKVFKKPRPCHLCHQPIHQLGSCCRVCKYVCHKACETKHIKETQKPGAKGKTLTLSSAINNTSANNNNISTLPNNNSGGSGGAGGGGGGAASAAKGGVNGPKAAGTAPRKSRGWGGTVGTQGPSKDGMDLRYVTERMIALWVPGDVSRAAYLQGQQQAANMLRTKHQDNYMVFNLSAPRRSLRHHHHAVRELGWPRDLAPPLERLCAICKDMDSWLKGNARRIAVVHARGSKDRIGVVVAAYMHYSHICGGADQALDRFAMKRFLQDQVQDVEQPSHRRYVDYFSGLLSGSIKINSAPLYLTHVTVLGAPSFEPSHPDGPDPGGGGAGVAVGGCRAFLKVYEGLVPVHTSAVYCAAEDARAFTVNVAAERGRRGLQLRGDVLVKCYHRHYSKKGDPNDPAHLKEAREIVFACQFHTCAVSDYTLSFTRSELDYACDDLRFPLDGAVELHFSPTPEPRLPSPAPTPAVPTLDSSDDPVTRWDSYEHLGHLGHASDDEDDDVLSEQDDELSHTYGPLDGSLYATVGRKQQLQQLQQQEEHHRRMLLQQQQDQHLQLQRARAQQQAVGPGSELTISMDSGISSAGNGAGGGVLAAAPSSTSSQRALDDLLNDMLLTVESIPDLKPDQQHHQRAVTAPPTMPSARADLQRAQRSGGEPRYQRAPTSGQSYGHAQPASSDTLTALTPGACGTNTDAALDDIPYHARLDGRPFTYVPGASNNAASPAPSPAAPMAPSVTPGHHAGHHAGHASNGLSSPSLVRKASGRGLAVNGYATSTPHVVHAAPAHHANGAAWGSPQPQAQPRFQDDILSDGPGSRSHLTWLQRQQQKLRERREGLVRSARQPHEARLLSELRSLHHAHSASRRLDGYTSDTTMFADEDEEDLCRPLHINTSGKLNGVSGGMSAPGSPLQRRAAPYTSQHAPQPYSLSRQKSDSSFDRERPFVAVKRGYEQRAKYHDSPDNGSPVHAAAYDRTDRTDRAANRLHYSNYSNHPYANGASAANGTNGASHYSTPRPDAVPVLPHRTTPTPLTYTVARTLFSPRGPGSGASGANHAVNGVGNGKHSGPPSPEDAVLLLSSTPPGGGLANGGFSNGGHSGGILTNGGLSNGRQPNGGLSNGGLSNGGLSNGGLSNGVLHQDALACLMASLASPSDSPPSASTASPSSMTPSPPAAFATSPTSPGRSPASHYQQQHTPARHCNASDCSTNSTASFAWQSPQQREDSYSSWRSEDDRFSRPQTPAFPVQPRTPYYNGHQFDSAGLPPKSPTTQRRSGSFKHLRRWPSNSSVSSKDRSPSPMSDQQGHGIYMQHSPKSPSNGGGQSSPSVYSTRRSSTHSNSEPPQEVAAHHVKFVRDTSRYWYKPNISREEAIAVLREAPPGTFVVRDSNSFPGAFGLALKVAVPPATVAQKAAFFSGDASELVRHFLIEPTSRGVKLKGCTNEPVFSSLSALVYQHSIMAMALPCKLLLPDGEIGAPVPGSGTIQARHVTDLGGSPSGNTNSHSVSSAHQLLAQGAACNVLYLFTTDTESLTGPQAIRRAVHRLFASRPLPSATVVHFKVSSQGITLTDNKRRLFFRRHYPVSTISHCGLDPDDHRWSQKSPETGMPISSNRCFGFVARKPASRSDNQCHIFAELEPEQPANAIVNFVSKVMMSGVGQKNVV
ncbi:tensin-1 [Thrips palmi]|uniref:Tensin-1 n=1 Tax=Thrips palmi TaxID=161013 RepID=A0A6P8ZH88_THRPL|nr:tensin-1 [Thrips palmi]